MEKARRRTKIRSSVAPGDCWFAKNERATRLGRPVSSLYQGDYGLWQHYLFQRRVHSFEKSRIDKEDRKPDEWDRYRISATSFFKESQIGLLRWVIGFLGFKIRGTFALGTFILGTLLIKCLFNRASDA